MEPVSTFKSIKQEASFWVSKMAVGLCADEKQQLVAWINADMAHHKAIKKQAEKHNYVAMLNELPGVFPLEKNTKPRAFVIALTVLIVCLILAASVSVNLMLNGSLFRTNTPTIQQTYSQSFQTMVGEQATYHLPDGSILKLNTNTFVKVYFNGYQRSLALLNGEANFNVAKDANRPFTVNVGEQAFTALGTEFNIHKQNNEAMKIIVTEGEVLLSHSTTISNAINKHQNTQVALANLPGILVKAGQQARVDNNVASASQTLTPAQLQQQTAWQQGILIFNGEKLSDALKEISRYNNTHFEIDTPELANVKISGYFKAGDINSLLLALNDSFDIEHKKISYHSIVLSKKS